MIHDYFKNKGSIPYVFFFLCLFFYSCSNSTENIDASYSFKASILQENKTEEFSKLKFEPFEDLNLGFFKGSIWIKLDIKNGNQAKSFMVINNDRINRNYVFYKLNPKDHSLKTINPVKDTSKQDSRTFNFPNPNFKIDLSAKENATYFIVTTSDGRTVDATPKLISMVSYTSFINENLLWSIAFLGVIFCLLLVNLYQWNIHRQKIYLYCIFYMSFTFVMYLGLEGHLHNFGIKHIMVDHIVFISIRLWVLSLLLYTYKFLEVESSSYTYYTISKWLVFIVLGSTTIYQFLFFNSSIAHLHYFENVLSFLWLFCILGAILVSAKKRKLELRYYLIPLSSFLLFIALGLIDGHFQLLPGTPFVYIKLGTIVEFIGFTYFMTVLIKRKLKQSENLEKELNKNKKELLRATKTLQEKEQLLSSKTTMEKTDFLNIFKLIESSLSDEKEWNDFKIRFEKLNPNFLTNLTQKHPDLTKSEIRLLMLIRIGFTQKEIASILNIAPDSSKKAKQRARKKLNIPTTVHLNDYLLELD